MDLTGKACVVTGAASGLGRGVARLAAAEGAMTLVSDIDVAGGEETVEAIRAEGGRAEFRRCDVTSAVEVDALFEAAAAAFGRVDCAVLNAGVEGVRAPVGDYGDDDWSRVIAVNLTGVFHGVRAAVRAMPDGGSIVTVASTAGLGGVDDMPAYTASKHGVVGLTKAAALAYAARGIRVNAICPGSFHTPMTERLFGEEFQQKLVAATPMQRAGAIEEIADAVVWLCSDRSSFVTGVALPVEGGKRAR